MALLAHSEGQLILWEYKSGESEWPSTTGESWTNNRHIMWPISISGVASGAFISIHLVM